MKLSILVPIYNEEQTLKEIIDRVLQQKVDGIDSTEIVMIDDCSTDTSANLMKQLANRYPDQIQLGFHSVNQGKGAAIRKAIEMATGDISIIQDADLEYDPADYPLILRLIIAGQADVVFGSRFLLRQERRAIYFKHALGNKFITFLSNWFTDLFLTDVETCYKAFRLDLVKTIPLRSNRFGIEVELVAKIARRKWRVYEVPISYYGRTYAEGKKITWKDGVSALWNILKYWVIDDSVK